MRRDGMVLVCWLAAASAWAGAAFVDPGPGLAFPQELGGLGYARAEQYDDPAFGYCVFYGQAGPSEAAVTVYTLGRSPVPDGHAGQGIDLVFQSVENGLMLRQRREEISDVRKRGSIVAPGQGRIRFASTVFQYAEPRLAGGITNTVQRIHAAYATGALGRFVKLDFSFDLVDGSAARAMAERMVGQLAHLLAAAPLDAEAQLMAACDALLFDPAGHGGRTAARLVLAKTQTLGNLNVYTHLFAWPDGYRKPRNADLLVAAYFAGMLKVVVPQNLDAGGEYEGFLGLLHAYGAMRARGDIDPLPTLDEWMQAADKRALFDKLLEEA